MATYGYCRVSTPQQAAEGDSLELQQRQINGYAAMNGWPIDRVFVERGISGSKPLAERPEGAAMLAVLQPGDTVIAAKLDRVFRSALDALNAVDDLKRRRVNLHLIDLGGDISGNGMSRLFLTIAAAFAEAERDRIRERIVAAKADQKSRNRYLGGVAPFGHAITPDGDLVELLEHRAAIAKIRRLRANGASLRTISAELAADGVNVSHVTIKKLLGGRDGPAAEPNQND